MKPACIWDLEPIWEKIAIPTAISWPPYVYEKGMESEFVSPKHCLVNWARVTLRASMILMSLFSAGTCFPTAFYSVV